jgi:hypothetical protein
MRSENPMDGLDSLSVRDLRAVVALAERLHFGKAAEDLSMAQPSLSAAVKKVEATLGELLFERTSRHVALTPAGQLVVRRVRAMLEELVEIGRGKAVTDRTRALPARSDPGDLRHDAGLRPEPEPGGQRRDPAASGGGGERMRPVPPDGGRTGYGLRRPRALCISFREPAPSRTIGLAFYDRSPRAEDAAELAGFLKKLP